MRIAFISQPIDEVLPPHQSSVGIWTYQIARRLASHHRVTVLAKWMRAQREAMASVPPREEVHYRFIRSLPNRVWLKASSEISRRRPPRRPLFASGIYNLEYALQAALSARRHRADIIHIHNNSQFVPTIRALNPDAKIVLHMHCEWLTQLDPAIIEPRLQQVDLIIGCSNYITQKIQAQFPSLSERCRTIYNGVDVSLFSPANNSQAEDAPDGKRILYVGRISPEKGVHVLVDAFHKVAERIPDARLELIGSAGSAPVEFLVALSDDEKVTRLTQFYQGDYLAQLRNRIDPDLASRVVFAGTLPHERLVERYRRASVLVNPSLSEAFGMSLVEAMATGVPVVAARTGGMMDIVEDGKTGEPDDPGALAEAILRTINNANVKEKMGEAGRVRAQTLFSWEQIGETLIHQYRQLLES